MTFDGVSLHSIFDETDYYWRCVQSDDVCSGNLLCTSAPSSVCEPVVQLEDVLQHIYWYASDKRIRLLADGRVRFAGFFTRSDDEKLSRIPVRIDLSLDSSNHWIRGLKVFVSGEGKLELPEGRGAYFKTPKALLSDIRREDAFYQGVQEVRRGLDHRGGSENLSDVVFGELFGAPRFGERKLTVVIPHQDDEVGIAGFLSRAVRILGPGNIQVLYIAIGDGNAWDKDEEGKRAFREGKVKRAIASCGELGIPEENIHILPASEVMWYNGFIEPTIRRMEAEGVPVSDDMPDDFKRVRDNLPAIRYTLEWMYSHMFDFGTDVIVAPARLHTVQLHDWAHILSQLAATQLAKEEGRVIDLFEFPQQNQQEGEEFHLYKWTPSQLESGSTVYLLTLTPEEHAAKEAALRHYASFWKLFSAPFDDSGCDWEDTKLFFSYLLMGAQKDYFMRHEYIRRVLPTRIENGLPVWDVQVEPFLTGSEEIEFEGNNEHYGVWHGYDEDYRQPIMRLLESIRKTPLRKGRTNAIDPFELSII